MTGSLTQTGPAIGHLVDGLIADKRRGGAVDHLLILADALDELADQQRLSGLTIGFARTAAEASRLREEANQRSREAKSVRQVRKIIRAVFNRTPRPQKQTPGSSA